MMKAIRANWLAALAVSGLAAGCVTAPVPEDITRPWTPPAGAQKEDEVWKAVRSGKIDFSKQQTLSDLADIALRNNPASSKAWNEARVAAEQVTFAQGYFMPELVATASGTRQKVSARPAGFDSGFNKYGPGLQLNYLIINFGGGRRAAVEQALQTVYATDFAFNKVLQDILLAVETAYYGVISARAGTESAEAAVKDAEKTLEAARERLQQGTGTRLEVLQAQALYDQAQFGRANAAGLFKTARGALAAAIGVPADTDILLAEPPARIPAVPAVTDMKELIDQSLKRRPDIAALRATLAAKEAAVKVARAAFWPSLFLNGSIGENFYDATVGKEMQDDEWAYAGTLSLQWTIFDGWQNTSEKHQALALAEAAKSQLRQAELAASADVWTRYHSYETALQKLTFSEAYLKTASASYDLALDSYKAQLSSLLDLLNSETQLALARTQNVAARQEAFTALANLAYSTGLLEKGGTSLSDINRKEKQ